MKALSGYLRVFCKPVIVPLLLILSFFFTSLVLLFSLNQQIRERIEQRMTQNERQSVVLFVENVDSSYRNIIAEVIPGAEISCTYHNENLIVAADDMSSFSNTHWLLDQKPDSVIVPKGYAQAHVQKFGLAPKTLEVLGKKLNIVGDPFGFYDEGMLQITVSLSTFFELTEGSPASILIYISPEQRTGKRSVKWFKLSPITV